MLSLVFVSCAGEIITNSPPTFSLGAATYNATQTLAIEGIDGAAFYYTLDGTSPTGNGVLYSKTLEISENTTVKAIARHPDFPDSSVTSAIYKIRAGSPQFSLDSDTLYTSVQELLLTGTTEGASIFYTLDGSDPKEDGISYVAGTIFHLTKATTVKAFSRKANMEDSIVVSKLFAINRKAETPVIAPDSGIYASAKTVSISATDGYTIYYTTDATIPTIESKLYAGQFDISANTTIKAIAVMDGFDPSSVAEAVLQIQATSPVFSLAPNTFDAPKVLSISGIGGATFHYTVDGSIPTATLSNACKLFSGQITIDKNTKVQAIAIHPDYAGSAVTQADYKIRAGKPTFSPEGLTHEDPIAVSLSSSTSGATIYYTIDGTAPDNSKTSYTEVTPIQVQNVLTTIRAISTKEGFADSLISEKTFIILQKSYNVSFDTQEGTPKPETKQVKNSRAYGILDTPERTGYTFGGWWTDSAGVDTQITEASIVALNEDQTLYAKWNGISYAVTLDKQEGSGGTTELNAIFGSQMPSDLAGPTMIGYAFDGYYATGGKQYYDASMESINIWDQTSPTTLYARWTANSYSITLNLQYRAGGTSDVTATFDSIIPSGLTAPIRAGYTFGGFYSADGQTQYYDAAMVSEYKWENLSNMTMYAKWDCTDLKVGDIGPAGGFIFYKRDTFLNEWNYLEVAPSGWSGDSDPSAIWGSDKKAIVHTKMDIGSGKNNTANIILGQISVSFPGFYAANLCDSYSVVRNETTFADWFLPSYRDLGLIYTVLYLNGKGDFTDGDYYWSSSDWKEGSAWAFIFGEEEKSGYSKSNPYHIRPARSF